MNVNGVHFLNNTKYWGFIFSSYKLLKSLLDSVLLPEAGTRSFAVKPAGAILDRAHAIALGFEADCEGNQP